MLTEHVKFSGITLLFLCFLLFLSSANAGYTLHTSPDDTCFKILMDGDHVGYDCVQFSTRDNVLIARRSIQIKVYFAGIPFYTYRHEDRERWENGSLKKLESWTYDNGDNHHVEVLKKDTSTIIYNGNKTYRTQGDVFPSSYWNHDLVGQSKLLDTQYGTIRSIQIGNITNIDPSTPSTKPSLKKHKVTGDINLKVGYNSSGQWRFLEFKREGYTFQYSPVDSTPDSWRNHEFYNRDLSIDEINR